MVETRVPPSRVARGVGRAYSRSYSLLCEHDTVANTHSWSRQTGGVCVVSSNFPKAVAIAVARVSLARPPSPVGSLRHCAKFRNGEWVCRGVSRKFRQFRQVRQVRSNLRGLFPQVLRNLREIRINSSTFCRRRNDVGIPRDWRGGSRYSSRNSRTLSDPVGLVFFTVSFGGDVLGIAIPLACGALHSGMIPHLLNAVCLLCVLLGVNFILR